MTGGSRAVVDDMDGSCVGVVYSENDDCPDMQPPTTKEPQIEDMEKRFSKYESRITDERRMKLAKKSAFYVHCLPCEHSVEVADRVLDVPRWGTPCYDEAENRLHAQKGVMACIRD